MTFTGKHWAVHAQGCVLALHPCRAFPSIRLSHFVRIQEQKERVFMMNLWNMNVFPCSSSIEVLASYFSLRPFKMSSSESFRDPQTQPATNDAPGRPKVKPFNQASSFYPGDKVYIRATGTMAREGPYLIESAQGGDRYILSDINGQTARNGEVVNGSDLVEAD